MNGKFIDGTAKVIRTRYGVTASTSPSNINDATTSFAVIGYPSWNCTSSRRSNSHTPPSAEPRQLVANSPRNVPSAAISVSVSKISPCRATCMNNPLPRSQLSLREAPDSAIRKRPPVLGATAADTPVAASNAAAAPVANKARRSIKERERVIRRRSCPSRAPIPR